MEVTSQDVCLKITAFLTELRGSRVTFVPAASLGSYGVFYEQKKDLIRYLEEAYQISIADGSSITLFSELIQRVLDEIHNKSIISEEETNPTAEVEKRIQKPFLSASLQEGKFYYLVSTKWLDSWKRYVDWHDTAKFSTIVNLKPGPVDNSPLVDTSNQQRLELKSSLIESINYEFVSEEAWQNFLKWYGGGPELKRKCIKMLSSISGTSRLLVEVYNVRVTAVSSENPAEEITITASRLTTLKEVKESVCQHKQWDPTQYKLYNMLGSMRYTELNEEDLVGDDFSSDTRRVWFQDITKEDPTNSINLRPYQGSNIVFSSSEGAVRRRTLRYSSSDEDEDDAGNLTPQKRDAPVGSDESRSGYSSYVNPHRVQSSSAGYTPYSNGSFSSAQSSGYSSYWSSSYNTPKAKGLTGLRNLGNTCFMNSGIQCLSNTGPLMEFLVSGQYKKDINRDNPLGMKGQIAEHFARLLQELWSGTNSSVAPVEFKHKLGYFAPQFSGYNQQDSQELLAFLLDGIHEDLNRVINKEYIETKDSDGRLDEVVAEEAWLNHLKRNNSIIVDLFQGQYKSKLVCPTCSRISITFDPFMYLSLPIPNSGKTVEPILVDKDGVATKYKLLMPLSSSVEDLRIALGKLSGLDPQTFIVKEVFSGKFYKPWKDGEAVADIGVNDVIFVYEVPLDQRGVMVDVFQKGQGYSAYSQRKGYPFILGFAQPTVTLAELREAIWKRVSRFVPGITEFKPELFEVTAHRSVDADYSGLPLNDETITLQEQYPALYITWSREAGTKFDDIKSKEIPLHASASAKAEKSTITILDCLNTWAAEERLSPKDPWYCSRCKEHKEATKKLDLWKLPKILVIHLKRFTVNHAWRDKNDAFIDFPLTDLDLSSYALGNKGQSAIYDLYAVSNHYGSMGGGHYTAYAKNKFTQKWYDFDDSSVSLVDEKTVKSKAAYVLFYARRDDDEGTSDESEESEEDEEVDGKDESGPGEDSSSAEEDGMNKGAAVSEIKEGEDADEMMEDVPLSENYDRDL